MITPQFPENEAARLAQLHELQLLDSPSEPAFEQLVELTALLLKVPIALVSLVDKDRQWFKARVGVDSCETGRDISFCGHVVADGEPLVVEDATLDPRFADNPLVTGAPHIRFYAGIPLVLESGMSLGTLCVIDTRSRRLDEDEWRQLQLLAKQTEQLIQLHQQRQLLGNQCMVSDHRLARYEAITQGAAAGIVRIDGRGIIQEINDYALSLLGYRRAELLEKNVSALMPEQWSAHHDQYLHNYIESGQPKVIGKGRRVSALHKSGHQVPVHLAVGRVVDSHQPRQMEFIGILTDLTEMHEAEQRERSAARQLQKQQRLLSVLHKGLTDYHALMSGNRLWSFLQEALRELTDSDYSLIGEVLSEQGQPELKIHAITDLSWNEESRQLMQKLQAGEMKLTNPHSMLGQVFAQGNTVLSNGMDSDERRGGFPPGHPPLHNYLGVPILDEGTVIGMYAIANGGEDYDQDLVSWLEPFTSTCALLIKLYRQLNEREQFTEQLRQARDQAEQASRAKTDFLSSMSHELRTPLNAIMGFAQLLQSNKRASLDERQLRQVEQIYKSGSHLLNLINEVLDLARIEAGRINMSLEAIQPREVIDDACDTLMPIARQQGVALHIDAALNRMPAVLADYTRLKQVMINLISNAIKYNRSEGKVYIGCRQHADLLRVSVRDTGPGIDPLYLEQLFQPFNRLGAENGAIEGTGVGLALTKSILEQMGGRIGVDNHHGEGCEFWFCLPLAVSSSRKAVADLYQEPQAEPVAGARRTVLYVEDNPANQRLMAEVFEERPGMQLECVHSAELAFEIACSNPPDLILMDISLPGMSGIEAAGLFGRHPLTRTIPIVALSANAMPEDIKRASKAGFRDYLTKPIDILRLLKVLDDLLEPVD
ncbi:GAF domain-containing protein [uncultured Oceanisphaera sp.]|uniref:GAF domain-containing protein n=1 Tax=uncultured Oceanisphaera sp. TaxID=353858 RepID=UPI002607EB93|nr:GAF domain-containing protein [uncultured Oceanisphaera sp.]